MWKCANMEMCKYGNVQIKELGEWEYLQNGIEEL